MNTNREVRTEKREHTERRLLPLSSIEATDATRVGPKAANLAALGHAGLRIPDGVCLDADAYRHQIETLGLSAAARGVFGSDDPGEARQHALAIKIGLLEQPVAQDVLEPLVDAWQDLVNRTNALTVVRSSALVED